MHEFADMMTAKAVGPKSKVYIAADFIYLHLVVGEPKDKMTQNIKVTLFAARHD